MSAYLTRIEGPWYVNGKFFQGIHFYKLFFGCSVNFIIFEILPKKTKKKTIYCDLVKNHSKSDALALLTGSKCWEKVRRRCACFSDFLRRPFKLRHIPGVEYVQLIQEVLASHTRLRASGPKTLRECKAPALLRSEGLCAARLDRSVVSCLSEGDKCCRKMGR